MAAHERLRTVKQLAAEAKFVTEAQLRWWIFHAEDYGLTPAIVKIGRRIYIDIVEFNEWLEKQRMAPRLAA